MVNKIERRMNYDNEQSSVEWWFFVVRRDDYMHLLLPHNLITNKWIASGYDLLGIQKTSKVQTENRARALKREKGWWGKRTLSALMAFNSHSAAEDNDAKSFLWEK